MIGDEENRHVSDVGTHSDDGEGQVKRDFDNLPGWKRCRKKAEMEKFGKQPRRNYTGKASKMVVQFWRDIASNLKEQEQSSAEQAAKRARQLRLEDMVTQIESTAESLAKKLCLPSSSSSQVPEFDSKNLSAHVTTPLPYELLTQPLRSYQHIGLHWLATLCETGLNGILADEMGLGKTIMTIALFAHLALKKGIWGPHLVIVPTSVQLNWVFELARWAPGFRVLSYHGKKAERNAKRQGGWGDDVHNVVVASYGVALADEFIFKRKQWHYLVLDEAQNIKNYKSKTWQCLMGFKSFRRLLLTGTPLQNDLMELWSLMHFLMPHSFGTSKDFKTWFADPMNRAVGKNEVDTELVRRLHNVLRPFMLRRLKSEVELELPAKHEYVINCRMSGQQKKLYNEFIDRRDVQRTLQSSDYLRVLNICMQLRKVCNHPELFFPRTAETPYTMEPIKMVIPGRIFMALYETVGRGVGCRPGELSLSSHLLSELPPSGSLESLASCTSASTMGAVAPALVRKFQQMRYLRPAALPRFQTDSGTHACEAVKKCWIAGHRITTKWSRQHLAKPIICPSVCRTGYREDESLEQLPKRQRTMADSDCSSADSEGAARKTRIKSSPFLRGIPFRGDCQSAPLGRASTFEPLPPRAADAALGAISWEMADGISLGGHECLSQLAFTRDEASAFSQSSFSRLHQEALLLASLQRLQAKVHSLACLHPFTFRVSRVQIMRPLPHSLVRVAGRLAPEIMSEELPASGAELCPTGAGGSWLLRWLNSERELQRQLRLLAEAVSSRRPAAEVTFSSINGWSYLLTSPLPCRLPEKRFLEHDCGKLQELTGMLKRFKSEDSKCIIFTQFAMMLNILEEYASFHGFRYVRLDGSVKVELRQGLVNRFNADKDIFLFLASTRAGGVGINLTAANVVIFYDSDWNPAIDRQATDRAHRIGQTREVHIYRMITENSVEQNIWQRQLQKRMLDDVVIDQGSFNPGSMLAIAKKQQAWSLETVRSLVTGSKEAEPPVSCSRASATSDSESLPAEAANLQAVLRNVEDDEDAVAAAELFQLDDAEAAADTESPTLSTESPCACAASEGNESGSGEKKHADGKSDSVVSMAANRMVRGLVKYPKGRVAVRRIAPEEKKWTPAQLVASEARTN